MSNVHDLIGVGIGPFNLSLAALSLGVPELNTRFFEQKAQFEWHSELVFPDATMQTTYLKDLVTPVDPTNPHSFLNFLVETGRFYAFLNTNRKTITRKEFEEYCRWTSRKLSNVCFGEGIREVALEGRHLRVRSDSGTYLSSALCLGTGLRTSLPEFVRPHESENCFHAKSLACRNADWRGKRVVIVGGGQTGAEVFLNGLRGMWGKAKSIRWISRRLNLEALDESAFANDYFTPEYVKSFHGLPLPMKDIIVSRQKLTSDGITPYYLEELYRELYQRTFVDQDETEVELLTARDFVGLKTQGREFEMISRNMIREQEEGLFADLIVCATGFQTVVPECLEPLYSRIERDAKGRLVLAPDFQLSWDGPEGLRLYAVNFGRHSHGIAEPQTSLMAWRSATIVNSLLGRARYAFKDAAAPFLRH